METRLRRLRSVGNIILRAFSVSRITGPSQTIPNGGVLEVVTIARDNEQYSDFKSIEWPETISEELYFFFPFTLSPDYANSGAEDCNRQYILDRFEHEEWILPVDSNNDPYCVAASLSGLLKCSNTDFEDIMTILKTLRIPRL